MELRNAGKKISAFIKKYRYIAIILLAGLILMCIPNKRNADAVSQVTEPDNNREEAYVSLEESLSKILRCIEGAGDVQVLLTLQRGEETVYQTDSHTTQNNENRATQIETVIVSGTDRNQGGLVCQVNPPTYLGAVVVCQGAESPSIRLAIVEAISNVTGLGADRISVLKMK